MFLMGVTVVQSSLDTELDTSVEYSSILADATAWGAVPPKKDQL